MGLLEKIDAKLSLICIAMNIDTSHLTFVEKAAAAAPAAVNQVAQVATQSAADLQVSVPQTSTAAASIPVARKTVAEALAAGLKLTGHELDEQGVFWCAKINTSNPAVTQKNVWKRGKGITDAVYDARIAEIKAIVAGEKSAAPAATFPAAGAGFQSSLEDKTRKEIIQFANVLHHKYKVDYATVGMLYAQMGAADHTFAGVPDANYPQLHAALNQWAILLDRIEESDAAVLALLNGTNGTYLIDILTQLGLGTNNLATVYYADLPKVYTAVHQYLNVLEAHFSRPITPAKAV